MLGNDDYRAGFRRGLGTDAGKLPALVSAQYADGYASGLRTAARNSGIPVSKLEMRRRRVQRA